MKRCPTCGQSVADEMRVCPACGQDVTARRQRIDDYRIVDVIHEGFSTFLCRAVRERTDEHVMLRLFTPQSGVNEDVAARLQREIEKLKILPGDVFVRHHAIRRSQDGAWYRVSEWVESESWGSLLASGQLGDRTLLLGLFHEMAEAIAILHAHGHFIPHLILNDLIAVREESRLRVKVDYKLSRFIDPKVDRPAPMLRRLLACHPDMVSQRPLDFRSDIWSLGNVFVALLSGDLDLEAPDAGIDALGLPVDLTILLKVMLADDPDLRPQSMREVADSLDRIRKRHAAVTQRLPDRHEKDRRPAYRTGKRTRWTALASIAIALSALLLAYLQRASPDPESALEAAANRCAPSVAFVLVEYWLETEEGVVFRNAAEGTAFLADREGYLLTSRHVVCPWLEDPTFDGIARFARSRQIELTLKYRLCLWFEGMRAFNPAGRMIGNPDVTDVYDIENSYSTEGTRRATILGVGRAPTRIRQLMKSPLKDDIAVIKIDPVPEGIEPLPLERAMDPRKLPKLSRVIALGFPLGSRTQVDTINTSVVRGSVRRAFENMFQIDASLHGGNSGGPVIDTRGKVIGIVSAVAVDYSHGIVSVATPVWDFGMILPIPAAVQLLNDLKAGHPKWNGVIDFSTESSVAKVREIALQGRWAEAMSAADERLGGSLQPALIISAAMLHFCNGDLRVARERFLQALSMDPDNYQLRFMLALIDWIAGHSPEGSYHQEIAEADWRSPGEFQGYLLQLLQGSAEDPSWANAWATSSERSWVYYVVGWLRAREGKLMEAETLFETSALSADPEGWELVLAKAKLDDIRKQRRSVLRTPGEQTMNATRMQSFDRQLQEAIQANRKRQEEAAVLAAKLAGADLDEKLSGLQAISALEPSNRALLGALAYANAAAERFQPALMHLRAYIGTGVRPTAMRLSLGLLEAGILNYQQERQAAEAALTQYTAGTRDTFFLSIGDYLSGRITEESLRRQAGDRPENILVACAAAGFWAEAKDKSLAMRFYREGVGSFLDDWVEFDFIRERLMRLKAAGPG